VNGEWGRHGDAYHHQRYMQEAAGFMRRRRCRFCTVRKSVTHLGMANGVCLAAGCEWHMRQWVRDTKPLSPKTADPKR